MLDGSMFGADGTGDRFDADRKLEYRISFFSGRDWVEARP